MAPLRLRLMELIITGAGLPDASVRFAPGLNLIVGASDTGKTLIFEALDFMLGAGNPLRRIPESEGYDQVFLSIDPTGRPLFTLRRAYAGGHFEATEYQNGQANPATATRTLKAAHHPDPDGSLSAYLLRAIGMIRLHIRKNATGDKKSLSFRDVSHPTPISEEIVIKQSSPNRLATMQSAKKKEMIALHCLAASLYLDKNNPNICARCYRSSKSRSLIRKRSRSPSSSAAYLRVPSPTCLACPSWASAFLVSMTRSERNADSNPG